MIYKVNVRRIDSQLRYLEKCIQVLEKVDLSQSDIVQDFAAQRALHLAVECMIDVGSVMIDGFIMRDPGGYLDIVDILEDEKVITSDMAKQLKELVNIREKLFRYYDELKPKDYQAFCGHTELYRLFIQHVKKYLQVELGNDYSQ